VSTYYLGCIVGAVLSRFIGDRIGRRRAVLFGCVWLTVGGSIQACSYGLPQMLVGRIIGGVGTGINTTAIPMWQVETSKKSHRGRLIIMQLSCCITGLVVTSWMNFGFTYGPANSAVTWRFPLALQAFWSTITFSFALFMVESPRWLILRGRVDEARNIIARLHALPPDHSEVENDLRIIVETVAHEMEQPKITIKDLLRGDEQQSLRRILLGCGVGFMQQAAGTNVLANYLPVVLTRSVGLSDRLALVLSSCNAVSLLFFGLAACFFIDSVGRRKLMLFGAITQSISFFMVAIGLRVGTYSMSIFATTFTFIYYAVYGVSYLSIPWLYPAEINSQRMRNVGTSCSTTTNWVFVYVVVLITPIGIENLGWRFYLIFGFCNAAFLPLVYFFYVETANLSLEQIDRLFEIKSKGGKGITWNEARQQVFDEAEADPEHKLGVVTRHIEVPIEKEDA
jgi:sugar porter (SP) family MFS transporter